MRNNTTRLGAIAAGLTLAAAGTISGATTAAAAPQGENTVLACYDTAKSYSKSANYLYYPTGYPTGTWLTTTSNCADINIRPNTNRYIKVCFDPSSGAPYCQSAHKYALSGQWNTIATNVANGTKFKFQFQTNGLATGVWAA
ncbi:hypothetical protein [Streptomyces sp. NBC_01716]|uniref:hypothetical protein n=1 Tax=Streptomyces sp. NBC_01716 TaxID=2975917 RepID=UPI002E347A94|nr:hypothetical protein [Streptomyces sp. NBC_01716]